MDTRLRQTGIDVVGVRPWGTHVCHVYESPADVLDTLVPFFTAGLAGHEQCVWVVADPLTETAARAALEHAVPALDRYLADGTIEILRAKDWYLEDDAVDPAGLVKRWRAKLAAAVGRGYEGLRGAGDFSWVSGGAQWNVVRDYERALADMLRTEPMMVLCGYPGRTTATAEILAATRAHDLSVSGTRGRQEIFEKDVRRQSEDELRKSEQRFRAVFENSAVGIVLQTGDLSGRFVAANAEYQRMLGYSQDELRELTFVDITYEADREANRRLAVELLEGRRESFTLTKRNLRKDGRLMWVSPCRRCPTAHRALAARSDFDCSPSTGSQRRSTQI